MMKSQPKRLSPPSTQSGFTIIESLLAILIVTALLIGIAPVITLSVATRLQARRVEQATQAARNYIDGVRSRKIALPDHIIELPPIPPGGTPDFADQRETFSDTNPPRDSISIQNCNNTPTGIPSFPYCRNRDNLSLYCADFDGDGACTPNSLTDLIIQSFRTGIDTGGGTPDDGSKGYLLGVRVYRAAAFDGDTLFQTTKEKGGKKVATNTAGTGDMNAPLVEMTTEVGGTTDSPYDGLCDRLGGCQQ